MFNIDELLKKNVGKLEDLAPPKRKLSELQTKRKEILEKIAELVQMEEQMKKNFWVFAGKFTHLKGEEGVKILNWMYDTALQEDSKEEGKWRRIKFWQLLEKTHE